MGVVAVDLLSIRWDILPDFVDRTYVAVEVRPKIGLLIATMPISLRIEVSFDITNLITT